MRLIPLTKTPKIFFSLILATIFYGVAPFVKTELAYIFLNISFALFVAQLILIVAIDLKSIKDTVLHRKFLVAKKRMLKDVMRCFFVYLLFLLLFVLDFSFLDQFFPLDIKGFKLCLDVQNMKNSLMLALSVSLVLLKSIQTIKVLNNDWLSTLWEWELREKEESDKELSSEQRFFKRVLDDNLLLLKKVGALEKTIEKLKLRKKRDQSSDDSLKKRIGF